MVCDPIKTIPLLKIDKVHLVWIGNISRSELSKILLFLQVGWQDHTENNANRDQISLGLG